MGSVSRHRSLVLFLWEIGGLKCKGACLVGQGGAIRFKMVLLRIDKNETQVFTFLGKGQIVP